MTRLLYRVLASQLYSCALRFYFGAIALISPFHRKAGLMTRGRRGLLAELKARRHPGDRYVWIHASSLGEFEQGRPLIELLKTTHPEYKICLTFFSPSGYEVRKNYPLADIVTYLPYDTSRSLRAYIRCLAPEKAIFIKYEVWLRTLRILSEQGVPSYLISAILRPGQVYFRSYGEIFRQGLRRFAHIFVQNDETLQLLRSIGIDQVTLSGDTRMDRVAEIARNAQDNAIVSSFARAAHEQGRQVLMVGSSWEQDEAIYLPALLSRSDMQLVIVPHEITENHIESIREQAAALRVVLYSEIESGSLPLEGADLLVVDRMGFLSSLYRYADLAYIGGGFGHGIHNTSEAAVYGIPVLFGPKHQKFMEAKGLIAEGGGFAIHNAEECAQVIDHLLTRDDDRKQAGRKAATYIHRNTGSTRQVHDAIFSSSPTY